MKTGEGKTLVATLAQCISMPSKAKAFMSSRSTIISRAATPNGWARSIQFLGLTVGVIVARSRRRRNASEAYGSDITYGTNNEFGFDYLRDNMKFDVCAVRSARSQFRDRRRSRLDPDRRSPNAADHFRTQRRIHRQVLSDRQNHSQRCVATSTIRSKKSIRRP